MFRYMRAFFRMIAGWFGAKTDALNENTHVIAATYDDAIAEGDMNFATAKNAVASLIGLEQDSLAKVKGLGKRIEGLNTIKSGAQVAMQRRVDTLRGQGVEKDKILADAEFMKHKAAYDDASSTLVEVQKNFDEKDEALKTQQKKLAALKAKLQQMQRHGNTLKEEKQEAIADVAAAKEQEKIDAMIAGIPTSTADNDLQKAREARKRVVNRAHVTAELAGNDALNAENEYLKLAETAKSNNELDKLLNWGEEKPKESPLAPAKLPE